MTIPRWIVKLCQFAECPVFLFSKSGHPTLQQVTKGPGGWVFSTAPRPLYPVVRASGGQRNSERKLVKANLRSHVSELETKLK
jgi:hypothetical protein